MGKMDSKTDPLVSIIVPTLNEEDEIEELLSSLTAQTYTQFEILVVDGGSEDQTIPISKQYEARTIIEDGLGEFRARNIGAEHARGDILINTCADVTLPPTLVETVVTRFKSEPDLVGLTGPGIPRNPPTWGKWEYALYNKIRYVAAKFGRFSTSTNFLACPADVFDRTDGFETMDINADGMMGRQLAELGKVEFDMDACVYISSRRMWEMGFVAFNLWYIYVLENFFPILSRSERFKRFKHQAKQEHQKEHLSGVG